LLTDQKFLCFLHPDSVIFVWSRIFGKVFGGNWQNFCGVWRN